MKRYQIIKPEMSETLRAIGKTNEDKAHELAISWITIATEGVGMSAPKFYGYYDATYRMFLERLEARDEK